MINQVKPGDTILVIKSKHRKREHIRQPNIWKTFKVFQVDDSYTSTEMKKFMISKDNSESHSWYLRLYNDEFVVVEPSTVTPNPGDKIIIASFDSCLTIIVEECLGKTYTVTKIEQILGIDRFWVENENGACFWFHRNHCEILKRTNASTPTLLSCPDCHGTGQIQLFTSIRKCRCQDE